MKGPRKGLTLAEACAVLVLSEQGVRDLKLAEVPDVRPVQFTRKAVRDEYVSRDQEWKANRAREAALHYGIIEEDESAEGSAAASSVGADEASASSTADPGPGVGGAAAASSAGALAEPGRGDDVLASLVRELQAKHESALTELGAERAGRAAAEARIDQLTEELRTANDVIAKLGETVQAARINPDADLDRPRGDGDAG